MPPAMPKIKAHGELYDLLCFLLMGACVWGVGTGLHVFGALHSFSEEHGLADFVMLGFCMSFGLSGAFYSKAQKLRAAIVARDQSQREAEAVARHDSMTGLANRRHFAEVLNTRLRERPNPDERLAVLLMDLDRFKSVNDVHGHAAGDAVLVTIADRLRVLLPPRSTIARLGGDEFAMLLDLAEDVEGLGRLSRAIIAEVSRPIRWSNSECVVGATIGISLSGDASASAETLIHAADIAMYQGKKDGRNNFRFFRTEMDDSLKARGQLEQELRVAINTGQIVPFFQPLVLLADNTVIGFEVLARWRHPTRGLLTPDCFIALAEETGMIADLCWSLLRQACASAAAWPAHLQLAINISPQQLQDRHLPDRILEILQTTNFAPERLEIEVTETALIADLDAARSALLALQKLGIRVALDDFGTGYSSIYHLKELKFDKLKIDRSYVTEINDDADRSRLVNALISLGASLGMATTAEGIENAGNSIRLAEQGCTYGQGFFFGKPMALEKANGFVRAEVGAGRIEAPADRQAA